MYKVYLSEEDYKEIQYCIKKCLTIPKDVRVKVYKLVFNGLNGTLFDLFNDITDFRSSSKSIDLFFPEINIIDYKIITNTDCNFKFFWDYCDNKGFERRKLFLKYIISKLNG